MSFLRGIATDIRKMEDEGRTPKIIVIARRFWEYIKQSKEFLDRLKWILSSDEINNIDRICGCKLVIVDGSLIFFNNQEKCWVVIGS